MLRFRTMLTLLVSCSLLACADTKRIAAALPTPPERLACDRAGPRPPLPPQYSINWSTVAAAASVADAVVRGQAEHRRYVAAEVERNGIVAGYILTIEGVNFVCFNNMQWRREFEAGLPKAD